MKAEEWQTCNDLKRLLENLRDKTTDRKLRLFACGCWVIDLLMGKN